MLKDFWSLGTIIQGKQAASTWGASTAQQWGSLVCAKSRLLFVIVKTDPMKAAVLTLKWHLWAIKDTLLT